MAASRTPLTSRLLCIAALFSPTIGLKAGGRYNAHLNPADTIKSRVASAVLDKIETRMLGQPADHEVQRTGCDALNTFVPGPQAQRAFEIMSEAALRTVDDRHTALTCLKPMRALVVSNLFFKNENPWLYHSKKCYKAFEALMTLWRRYPDDKELRQTTCNIIGGTYGVGPEHTNVVRSLGGFDLLFESLNHFSTDADYQMLIYRALSDPSYTTFGADAMANVGGPLKGIEFLVEQMKSHPQPHLAESSYDHLALLYEIMQVSAGILNAGNRSYAEAFVNAGFLDQVMYAMEAEPDLRGTNDVACKVMREITNLVPELTVDPLLDKGAVTFIAKAMQTFHDDDPKPFTAGHTLGNEYPVVNECVYTLTNMARFDPEVTKENMEDNDMEQVLSSIRPDIMTGTNMGRFGPLSPQVEKLRTFLNGQSGV